MCVHENLDSLHRELGVKSVGSEAVGKIVGSEVSGVGSEARSVGSEAIFALSDTGG